MSAPTLDPRLATSPAAAELATALRSALGDSSLPARGDHILADLVRRHVPGELLWRTAALPTGREYATFDEVALACADVEPAARPSHWHG
jgi:hypothetical protein